MKQHTQPDDSSTIGRFDPPMAVTSEQDIPVRPARNLDALYRERSRSDDERAAHLAKLTAQIEPVLVEAEALALEVEGLAKVHSVQLSGWKAIPWRELEERGAPSQAILWSRAALAELEGIFDSSRILPRLRRKVEGIAETLVLDRQGPENLCANIKSRVKHAREYPAFIARKVAALECFVGEIVLWMESHKDGRR